MTLEQRHRQHCIDDIAPVFWLAAQERDYVSYARWLSEFRRVNLEELPRIPLKRDNLNVLFNSRSRLSANPHFMKIYMATTEVTGRYEANDPDTTQAVENCVLEDSRQAIVAALAALEDIGTRRRLKAMASMQIPPALLVDSAMDFSKQPDEAELRSRIDLRLAAL